MYCFRLRKEWEVKAVDADSLWDKLFIKDTNIDSSAFQSLVDQRSSPSSSLASLHEKHHISIRECSGVLSEIEKSLDLFAEVKSLEDRMRIAKVCENIFSSTTAAAIIL